MRRIGLRKLALFVLLGALGALAPVQAQLPQPHERDPVPPPRPPRTPEKDVPEYDSIVPDSGLPWGLSPELLGPLYEKAAVYEAYTRRFDCEEQARVATYKATGEVGTETSQRYGYLLVRDPGTNSLREYRQVMEVDGELKGAVRDEEPFPPAYAWVFLFDRFNEPYFSFRYLGDRFDGFDWVHEIEFQGSLPFTHGRDIRQWEGRVLIDAVTYTPLEIRAEPSGQRERIETLYRRYAQAFKFFGLATKPKPLGYTAAIHFRHRRDALTFPTELRYDTFRAISPNQVVPVRASTRMYENYRITRVTTAEQPGPVIDP
jgi:hypothetical protein